MGSSTDSPISPEQATALLTRHAPILRFDQRELFFPIAVEPYVHTASLWDQDLELVPHGSLRADQLDHRWGRGISLRWIDDEDRKAVVKEEASRLARKLLSPRLGRVGLFGRVLDALFLMSVLLRPTTPRRTTPAAALKAERLRLHDQPACYGRVVQQGEWLVLHYSYFYVMNDWRTGYRGLNDHEADWEQIWMFLDPHSLAPCWVAASSHDHSGPDLRRSWDDPEVIREGQRPVLHVAAGSHAQYFLPGDYVTRLEVPALRWALRLQQWARSMLRIRDEATERGLGPALGVPFVETATGDGRVIDRWAIHLIGPDSTPIMDYRGLWGLDTGDPLEGERGPSGPKFTRRGEVRLSWADPIGFVGLQGTPPPSAIGSRINQDKLTQVLEDLDVQIRRRGRLLPLAEQTGNPEEMDEERHRLTELLRQRVELEDLARRADIAAGGTIVGPAHIRAHLRHPALPLPPPAGTGWLLAFWAAISIPLLLIAAAAILLVDQIQLAAMVLIVGSAATVAEQLARRHFQAAARLVGLYLGVGAVLLFAVGGVLIASRYLAGVLLMGAAGLLFFVNLGELGAAQRYRAKAAELAAAATEPASGPPAADTVPPEDPMRRDSAASGDPERTETDAAPR